MFNPRSYENSRGGGVAVLEVPEELRARGRPAFVPLRRTEIGGQLLGPLAALTVGHVFRYERAQCDRVLEAVYRFPLPGDAAVTGVVITFGVTEIRAELKERAAAAKEYAEAREQGRQAALVEREAPDVFSLRVAGLRPDEEVVVETSYIQMARREGADWSVRLPLTVAPRYSRSDERGSLHEGGQPGLLARDPGHTFVLDLLAETALTVQSTTHALRVEAEDGHLRVRLAGGEVMPDRDCVLAWRPPQDETRPSLTALVHSDRAEGQVYFLALVAPPANPDPERAVAREVLLLTDHSGSMQGAKWEAADWATKRFISDLNERDAFNLGVFHNRTAWFGPAPVRGGREALTEATRFLEAHRDSGGTELGVALEQALRQSRAAGTRARHVLVITDAQVSDLGRVLRLAEEETRREDRRRISVLCIDAAPNSFLAHELAERGGGVARFLTSNPDEGDVTTALDEVLADWSQPILAGLRLEVDRPRLEGAGRNVLNGGERGWAALDLGDLPGGRAVWVAGRAPLNDADELRLRLRDGEGREAASVRMPLDGQEQTPALKALFGARRVTGLEFLAESGRSGAELADSLRRLGYDAALDLAGGSAPALYAENTHAAAREALRCLLVRESLRYGLVSAATAFVAVRREEGRPVEETVVVPNALPAGWADLALGSRGFASAAMGGRFSHAMLPRVEAAADEDAMDVEHLSIPNLLSRIPSPASTPAQMPAPTEARVYAGSPTITNGEAVLFDSANPKAIRFDARRLGALSVRFPEGQPAVIDPRLVVLVYVDDLATPRARARLADLLLGERPLNIALPRGCRLVIVLRDPAGTWVGGSPLLELHLRA